MGPWSLRSTVVIKVQRCTKIKCVRGNTKLSSHKELLQMYSKNSCTEVKSMEALCSGDLNCILHFILFFEDGTQKCIFNTN